MLSVLRLPFPQTEPEEERYWEALARMATIHARQQREKAVKDLEIGKP